MKAVTVDSDDKKSAKYYHTQVSSSTVVKQTDELQVTAGKREEKGKRESTKDELIKYTVQGKTCFIKNQGIGIAKSFVVSPASLLFQSVAHEHIHPQIMTVRRESACPHKRVQSHQLQVSVV